MSTLPAVERRVEHVDTDAAGVVHFTRYASLLETAVLENLEQLGCGVGRLAAEGLDLAVAQAHFTYRAPARFLDLMRITPRVDRVGRATCRIAADIHRITPRKATLLATGTVVLCVVGRADGGAAALPGRMRRVLREHANGEHHG